METVRMRAILKSILQLKNKELRKMWLKTTCTQI